MLPAAGHQTSPACPGAAASLIHRLAPCARCVLMVRISSTKASRLCRVAAVTGELLPGVGERSGRWWLSRATPGPECQVPMLRRESWQTDRLHCAGDVGTDTAKKAQLTDIDTSCTNA